MKIMHLISGMEPEDARLQILELVEQQRKHHQVELVCLTKGDFTNAAWQRGLYVRIPQKRNLLSQSKRICKYLEVHGFDLLHCHDTGANKLALLMGSRRPFPVISTVYANPGGRLNRAALKRMDGLVVFSSGMRELLIEQGCDGGRIWVGKNGIRFPKTIPHQTREEYLGRLGASWGENHVVFGTDLRTCPAEERTVLLKAFGKALQNAPQIRLLLGGAEAQRTELQNMAKAHCAEGTVCFAPIQDDTDSFYHSLAVNLPVSVNGAFPKGLLEGARMHCCTISVGDGGALAVTPDVVPQGDWEALAGRMVQLSQDGKLRTSLGRAIYEKARGEFTVEAAAKGQEEIYSQLLLRFFESRGDVTAS